MLRTIKRRQGIFLFTFGLVTGILALNTLRQRIFSPVYEGGFQLQIANPFETSGGGGSGPVEAIARSTVKNDVPSLIVLMRSPLLIRPVALKQGVAVPEILGNLNIQPAEEVQEVLNVNLRWRDPVKGRAILTQLSQEYARFSLQQRQSAVDSGMRFLDKQAPDIEGRVEKLQRELREFRQRHKFLDPSSVASSIQGTRDGLVSQSRSLQLQQAQLESQLASVRSGKLQFAPSGAPSTFAQMGPTSVAIPDRSQPAQAAAGARTPSEQLNEYEKELAAARGTFREDSPVVQSIKARRDQLMPVVQQQAVDAIRSQLLAIGAQQDEINRQILLLNDNFRTSPMLMKEYEDLQQQLAVARNSYASYIQARENFRLERARTTRAWQVISPPEFGDVPVEPNIQRELMRALMIGLGAGLAAALLREKTDNVFHTPMEAEKDLQLPVLGLIPHLPLEPGVDISTSISKMTASERFAIKESLRSLFTTFRLLRADRNIRLVGVTSSTQGEGKSTSVTIFARTLADLGLKVLIVDSDMRLPMQSRYLGIAQGDGLSTLLSDPSVQPSDLIQNIQENLDVLPSGPKPPDPAKLLNSQRCQEVIDEIRSLPGYDIVLFDAPPCLMLADPILLGEKLDGILFLVGLGKVSRDVAPQAARRIKATGVDVLGLICNQVNFPSRLNDYGYEYGYYYHYAYAGNYGNLDRYNKYGSYGKSIGSDMRGSREGDSATVATLSTPVDASASEAANGSGTPTDRSRSTSGDSGESRPGGWLRRFGGDKKP
ncbi:polysaccharide biosynthesis tyrosine autokinase [Cyanobium sp. FGCU-52]|nr:polysaccharide biosynthesis tyrosine autokinase [Cyanobium sp. FGCU52]